VSNKKPWVTPTLRKLADPLDIVTRLQDLHRQATEERSHYYVASCANDAIAEIEKLRRMVLALCERIGEAK
jgi:hypothetical protein